MKKFLAVFLTVAVVFSMIGCSSGGSGSNAGGSTTAAAAAESSEAASEAAEGTEATAGNPLDHNGDGKLIIGVEVQTMTSDWHINYSELLKNFWYENGADEVIISSSELDANKGITDVQAFMAANVDAAFIVPDSYDAINDVVQQARESGMLVSVNCTQEQVANDCGSTFDHYSYGAIVGQIAGEWLLSKGYEKDKVALDSYSLSKQELLDRYDGMKETLLKLCPDVQIVAEYVSADLAATASNAELALTSYPDLKAIVTLNNGLSMLEIVKTMGYNNEDFGLFCGEPAEALAEALVAPDNVAFRGFAIMALPDADLATSKEILKALKGEEYENMVEAVPPGGCTLENVYEWYPEVKK